MMTSPKIKILYVSHSSDLGGAERVLVTLIANLDKNAFSPVVVLPQEGPLAPILTGLGAKVYYSPIEWWVNTEFGIGFNAADLDMRLLRLSEIIVVEKPAVIHSITSVICEGALAAKRHNIPHIWHLHEILHGNPTITPLLPLTLFYSAIDMLSNKVVVVSDAAKAELKGLIAEDKLVRIYNGVELPPAEDPSVRIRKELGIPDESLVVLTGATLSHNKDIKTLLDAAKEVTTARLDIKFLLAGGGSPDLVAEICAQIVNLRLENTFYYLGHRDDFRKIIAECNVLVVTSVKESFSLTTVEAMAAGKPVISTNCGGPSELIIEGETGYVVPVGDAGAISNCILALASSPETMKTLGQAGLERYQKKYSAKRFAADFIELYKKELLDGAAKASEPANKALDDMIQTYLGLISRERSIAEQRWLLEELKNQLWAKEMQVAQQEWLMNEQKQQLAMLETEVLKSREDVEHLLNSWSWRVTKPARTLAQFLSFRK